jgi:hypothetical protein
MYYSFYNSGTVYFFKPGKPAYDIRDGVKRTALEFHTKLVQDANRVDCFVCNDHGQIVVKSAKNATHIPGAEYKRFKANKRKFKHK